MKTLAELEAIREKMRGKVAVREAAKGNPKFWEIIRDTAGQKPVEQIMVAEVDPAVIDEVEKAVLGK